MGSKTKIEKIRELLDRKEYVIHFQKVLRCIGHGQLQETNDAYILYILSELQKEYDFEIVSTNLKGAFATSEIVIRCDKNDKSRIFTEFCLNLSSLIENIEY